METKGVGDKDLVTMKIDLSSSKVDPNNNKVNIRGLNIKEVESRLRALKMKL